MLNSVFGIGLDHPNHPNNRASADASPSFDIQYHFGKLDGHKRGQGHLYYVNGTPVGTKVKDVHTHIKAFLTEYHPATKHPTLAVVTSACQDAATYGMDRYFIGITEVGWKVQRHS